MLFTGLGRSVWEKTVPLVLSTALGLRPRAVLKTSGTVFSHTDLPHICTGVKVRLDSFKLKGQLLLLPQTAESKGFDGNDLLTFLQSLDSSRRKLLSEISTKTN